MTKRKITLVALSLALIAILAVGGTLAYFVDADSKTNTFTVGNVDITLTEPNWDTSGSVDAPEVYPGEKLAKDPTVTNIGKNPCFVRVKVTGWECLAPADKITYRTDYVDGALGTDWQYNANDDYFYCTKVLAAGESTDALFDQIVIPTNLTNGNGNTEYNLVVSAEAVQAQGALDKNWADVQAMTMAEIAEWFGICMSDE